MRLDARDGPSIAWGMSFKTAKAAILWCVVALATGDATAEDWPQWRGEARDGHASPTARILEAIPAEPKVVWRLKVGEGFASPVVSGGKVVYFDNQSGRETIHAIQANKGAEIWRADIDGVFTDEQGPPGPRCTPVVDGDLVFAQSGKGELQCLDFGSGRKLWGANFLRDFGSVFLGEDSKVPGAAEHGYTASPLVVGEKLVACVGGTNGAGVVCFAKRTGKILWKSQEDLAAYAAPVAATLAGRTQIVCFTVEGLIGLDPAEGKLLWRFPLKTNYGRNCATPVVVGDTVVTGSYRSGLVGVRISREGEVFKAAQAWVNKAAAVNFSCPVALGGLIYGLGPTRNVFCVDSASGRTVWSKEGYVTTSADVAHAAFLVLRDKLLVCTDGGQLILLRPTPDGPGEIGRAQVCGLNWCNPAYANGRLFVRDGIKATGDLYCLELAP